VRGQPEMQPEVHHAESLNVPTAFICALADILAQHLKENNAGAPPAFLQMGLRCPSCTNATCAQQNSFIAESARVSDAQSQACLSPR
jgi:ferrochelatase